MGEPRQNRGHSRQDYSTSCEFLCAVRSRFGRIDVDLAARKDNAVTDLFIGPDADSLTVPWARSFGGALPDVRIPLAWCNPEFANIRPWVAKAREETRGNLGREFPLCVLLLVPAAVGSAWFRDFVHGAAKVFVLSPRLQFEGETAPYPKDCMLLLFGPWGGGFDLWQWSASTCDRCDERRRIRARGREPGGDIVHEWSSRRLNT